MEVQQDPGVMVDSKLQFHIHVREIVYTVFQIPPILNFCATEWKDNSVGNTMLLELSKPDSQSRQS